eukprot:1135275-Heterocapsa_arctica.AAC.1
MASCRRGLLGRGGCRSAARGDHSVIKVVATGQRCEDAPVRATDLQRLRTSSPRVPRPGAARAPRG